VNKVLMINMIQSKLMNQMLMIVMVQRKLLNRV